MANNRLYIGNRETGEFRCISKSGYTWAKLTMSDLKLINEIILTDNTWSEKSYLVFFTETDNELWHYFFDPLYK